MTNVLKNAAEAVDAKLREAGADYRGRIAVEVEIDERCLTVCVPDNGVGCRRRACASWSLT
jgi:two-component system nitrogen regulation sensor histidine kinase NtrY